MSRNGAGRTGGIPFISDQRVGSPPALSARTS